ncbi:MAG: hypothetical protein FJ196_00340 [Gammaproteobacteria bacterium]|nr:hypothetical protein [Gammaproteobacteria bacterium]
MSTRDLPANAIRLPRRYGGVLSEGDTVLMKAGSAGARFFLLIAVSICKPIVRYRPFVMNPREEIDQGIRNSQSRRLVVAGCLGAA